MHPNQSLITWNCRVGGFRKKSAHIATYQPDVLAVQEVEPLDRVVFAGDTCTTDGEFAADDPSSRCLLRVEVYFFLVGTSHAGGAPLFFLLLKNAVIPIATPPATAPIIPSSHQPRVPPVKNPTMPQISGLPCCLPSLIFFSLPVG